MASWKENKVVGIIAGVAIILSVAFVIIGLINSGKKFKVTKPTKQWGKSSPAVEVLKK